MSSAGPEIRAELAQLGAAERIVATLQLHSDAVEVVTQASDLPAHACSIGPTHRLPHTRHTTPVQQGAAELLSRCFRTVTALARTRSLLEQKSLSGGQAKCRQVLYQMSG